MRFWKRWWQGKQSETAVSGNPPAITSILPTPEHIRIEIPTLTDPAERHQQYAQPLATLLAEAEAGKLIAQRNLLQKRFSGLTVTGSVLMVETAVADEAIPVIRNFLVGLECPAETAVCLFMPRKKRLLVYRDEPEILGTKE